jgi:hypothetical protein
MATITVGQYAISDCVVKIKTSAETYSPIADLEEMSLSIDNNIETWYSISGGGWQNALMTARALTGSFSGKRTLGDTGNDYLNSKRYANSTECNEDWQIEFPDGSKLEFNAVTALTDIMGAATDVAPLSGDLTGRGKPTFTPAGD